MAELLQPDICVIGAGSAGLTVAAAAAAFGVAVVLIEHGRMGGDCLNTGCVPSKSLIAAARKVREIEGATAFGVEAGAPKVDFARVMAHVREVIAGIAPNDSVERFTGLGVRVIEASAEFVDPGTVRAGGFEVRARRFVLATGSRPALPPIEGLADVGYLTNESVFDLCELPRRLAVIGAGPIGLELAQAFRRLGSEVVVLEAAVPLSADDPEMTAIVLDALAREGVEIRTGAKVTRIERGAAGVAVNFEAGSGPETAEASHLLVAAGRRPSLEWLGLERAGIAYEANGISVDAALRTSNRRVYAIGDVAGGPLFTHVAGYHGGLVVQSILSPFAARTDLSALPWVTFTEPELAHAGLGEAEAARRHGRIRVLRWPYCENDRARAERRTIGHIKVVTDRRGRILGTDIVGENAGEMINMWSLAIGQKLKIGAMRAMISPYPTYAEIGKRAALTYYSAAASNALLRRAIRFILKFK